MYTRESPIPNELHGVVVLIAETLSQLPRDDRTSDSSSKAGPPAAPRGERAARTWLDRFDDWLWQRRQPDRETFLEWTNYVADLDRLLRASERGEPARSGSLARLPCPGADPQPHSRHRCQSLFTLSL